MKKLPLFIGLTIVFVLSACGKHGVTGFYSYGSTGYDFSADGHVTVYDKRDLAHPVKCSYVVNGDIVQATSADEGLGGVTFKFKKDAAGLHELDGRNFTYVLGDLSAFKASVPAPKSSVHAPAKTF